MDYATTLFFRPKQSIPSPDTMLFISILAPSPCYNSPMSPLNQPAIAGLLSSRRAGGVPSREKGTPLNVDDKLLLLWGMYREYSIRQIGILVGCAAESVRKYRDAVLDDPLLVFELPVYVQQGPKIFRCEFCSAHKETKSNIIRHVLAHVVPAEMARDVDLRSTNGRIVL